MGLRAVSLVKFGRRVEPEHLFCCGVIELWKTLQRVLSQGGGDGYTVKCPSLRCELEVERGALSVGATVVTGDLPKGQVGWLKTTETGTERLKHGNDYK